MHECSGSYQHSRSTTGTSQFTPTGYSYTPSRRATRFGLFGENEIRDLGIGLGVIILISLTNYWRYLFDAPLLIISALFIYGMAFILHELAHKFSAQMFGYWAEFKINRQGLMLTLFSLISPFKIIAPGAVMISNIANRDHYGKVAAAGPATNIALGLLFMAMKYLSNDPFYVILAVIGMDINSTLALFNLLPFGVFDGAKIIRWNKYVWGASVVAAGLLYFVL